MVSQSENRFLVREISSDIAVVLFNTNSNSYYVAVLSVAFYLQTWSRYPRLVYKCSYLCVYFHVIFSLCLQRFSNEKMQFSLHHF